MELTSGLFTAYAAIVTMAVVPIYIGSFLSLGLRDKAEKMTSKDAWKFPFIGSGVLFGLYMLFKMFSKEHINMLLTAYFLLFGVLAVSQTIKPLFLPFFPKKMKTKKYSWVPFWKTSEPIEVELDKADYVALLAASVIGVWYVMTKHWIANNILGLSFSIQGVAMLSLGTYQVGCILLGGLFFYDIFWVFATDVMVTVAKSFDAPIKLMFPKDIFAATEEKSMLGLGDIVIPGVFIALLLRFDHFRSGNKKKFSRVYFNTCLIAYFFGLVATIFIMHTFRHAQPALLYLVPACIGSSFGLAVLRGEVSQLLAFKEESESEKKEETKEAKSD